MIMDDSLLAEFHSVFSVSGDVNASTRPHPTFSSLYKHKREGYGEQETRRRCMLDKQRSRRRDYADYVRKIAEGVEWEEEMDDDLGEDEVDAEHTTVAIKDGQKQKKKRRVHPFRNQLMMSEWLVDKPEDFDTKWYMTICPIGKRSLVISSKRTTTAYARNGTCINSFPSLLPGGCKRTWESARDYCILDCIFHESLRTYFVLDIMCWRAHPVYDSDRDFRIFWLTTKLKETQGLGEISRINPYIFKPLDSFSCSKDSLEPVLSRAWPLEVDGLLFFHKYCHYKAGTTPLATWLKPHMVPEILGIPVSDEFLACAPRMSDPMDTPLITSSGEQKTTKKEAKNFKENSHQTATQIMES